jgi:hypothetical protein
MIGYRALSKQILQRSSNLKGLLLNVTSAYRLLHDNILLNTGFVILTALLGQPP